MREIDPRLVIETPAMLRLGLSNGMIAFGISYVHQILDGLDATLIGNGETRLAELLELANLSAVIGNVLRGGVSKSSNGRFVANGPHKYPDLLSTQREYDDLEIKVALETNKPKGHLAKPGPHLICRYVLGHADGTFRPGKDHRGDVAWIWEIRAGVLEEHHFNISNTAGDSGKTAVINAEGFEHLQVAYCNLDLCPYSERSPTYRDYKALLVAAGIKQP